MVLIIVTNICRFKPVSPVMSLIYFFFGDFFGFLILPNKEEKIYA